MKRERRGKVLLIEDDVALLQLISVAFEAAGYEVQRATDGGEGLKLFQMRPADLVVTDMIMPVREGVETIVALKKASATVKIIAISGGFRIGPQDYLTLARHVGADDVLAKPFHIAELVAAAGRLLGAPDAATPGSPPRGVLEAAYDMAERLDDAVLLARLLVAAQEREAAEAASAPIPRTAVAGGRRRPRRA